MARPSDVPFELLPVGRRRSWGAHWGAMIRYLEERAPCVYIPGHDWRHSCVSPLLAADVAVVAVVQADDPLHIDHVRRLGRYWNAVVAHDEALGERLREDPAIAPRVTVFPHCPPTAGLDFLDLFATVLSDMRSGAFVRPRGVLEPPPAHVAGTDVFPVQLEFVEPRLGRFPSREPDYREFLEHRDRRRPRFSRWLARWRNGPLQRG